MYQAPPPTRQPQHRQADRYALAIGALVGLIHGLLYSFEIWPGNYFANGVVRIVSIFLLIPPYLNIDDLVFVDWIARVRTLLWVYAGLAALVLVLALAVPQSPGGIERIIIIGVSFIGFAGLSLLNERRWIRPKI
jgi:hypothetical protein